MLVEHRGKRPSVDPIAVYGLPRSASARERMERQAEWFGAHREDRLLDEEH